MPTLQELIAQREDLDRQIATLKKADREKALRDARDLIDTYDLTADELFGKTKSVVKTSAAKYRNPETGETWSGRGRAPRWLEGKNRDDFSA